MFVASVNMASPANFKLSSERLPTATHSTRDRILATYSSAWAGA